MVAVPFLPSLVAVIVVEPAIMPVTRPLEPAVATLVLPLAHVTTRPVRVLPAESFVTAVSCRVALTAIVAEAGRSVAVATGPPITPDPAVPALPFLVAALVTQCPAPTRARPPA